VRFLALVSLALIASACSRGGHEATVPSSANQAGYAERYPTAVAVETQRLGEQEQQAQESFGKFAGYPDALKDPSWSHVSEVVTRADAAGKSADYARQAEQGRFVEEFFEEEKTELHRRVAGSVEYTAKQKGCNADLGGAAAGSMDKAVEKVLEKRLRQHNEAHRYIDDHEAELGKANVEKLREQADEISRASFLVYVGVHVTRRDLEAMVAEANEVTSTLDRTSEESNQILSDPNAAASTKKAAQVRLDAAERAVMEVDEQVKQAQAALEKIDERIRALQEQYEKALEELKKKIDEEAEAQTATAKN
jgi:chromosome segregation ATPase